MGELIQFPLPKRGITAPERSPEQRQLDSRYTLAVTVLREIRHTWGIESLPHYEGDVRRELADLAIGVCAMLTSDDPQSMPDLEASVEMLRAFKELNERSE